MATQEQHRSKALRNERLIQAHGLANGEFVEWAVTALFYAALHWLRALLAQQGIQIASYAEEDRAFEQLPLLTTSPQPRRWYRMLGDESRHSRYGMKAYMTSDFQDLEHNYYGPFRRFILSHLRG
jgi:HEPN domain